MDPLDGIAAFARVVDSGSFSAAALFRTAFIAAALSICWRPSVEFRPADTLINRAVALDH